MNSSRKELLEEKPDGIQQEMGIEVSKEGIKKKKLGWKISGKLRAIIEYNVKIGHSNRIYTYWSSLLVNDEEWIKILGLEIIWPRLSQ